MRDEQDSTSEANNIVNLDKARQKQEEQRVDLRGEYRRRDRLIDQLNKEWCFVLDHGKGWYLQEIDNSLRPVFSNIFKVTKKDFKDLYEACYFTMLLPTGKKGEIEKHTHTYAEWWLMDPRRRNYPQVDFAPGGNLPKHVYNMWRGFAVQERKPQRGVVSWELMQDHIFNVICSGNNDWYDYLINWKARMVQQPSEPAQTVPVLRGGEGVGKNLYGSYPLTIFGPHALHLSDIKQLVGRFNLHLQNCIYVLADEAGFYPGDHEGEGVMRALITEERLAIEGKYENLYQSANCLHPMIFSNKTWVFPMAVDARRPFVLDVPDTRKDQPEYFKALGHERDHLHGPAAMLWDLKRRDIRHFDVRQVPDTPAGREQKRLSLDTIGQYWMKTLERAYPYRSRYGVRSLTTWPECGIYSIELLWCGYQQFCDDSRRYQRQNETEFRSFLDRIYARRREHIWLPTHEIQTPLQWARASAGGKDPRQDSLYKDEPQAGAEPYWLPDDENHVVMCRYHVRGYALGSHEEAIDRFEAVMGNLDWPWRAF
jgi:hypothetical protein